MHEVTRFARNAGAAAVITTTLAAGAAPQDEPPSTRPETAPTDDGLPSLDELLGLEPADRVRSAVDVADRERQRELERQLAEAQLADAFAVALEKMAISADLLERHLDSGLGTQRVQEDILAKLDHLIEQARNLQNADPSASSAGGQPSDSSPMNPGQQPDQSTAAGRQSGNPSDSGQGDPPPRQDGAINTVLEENRTEWGNLPQRVRQMMLQGQRGKYSRLYRELTREYYKRLAEEASF